MLQHWIAAGIFTPVQTGLATYDGLRNAIGNWLNRSNLGDRIPEFIQLAEARLNRLLRDPDQIVSGTLVFSGGSASLPVDFGQLIAFGPAGTALRQVTPEEFGHYFPAIGYPQIYTVSGNTIRVLPAIGSTAPFTYYRGIQALSPSNPSNWLLTRAPDVYLYAALVQAEFFGWNDERLPLIKGALDEAIAELRADGENRRWGAAPLAARIRRS